MSRKEDSELDMRILVHAPFLFCFVFLFNGLQSHLKIPDPSQGLIAHFAGWVIQLPCSLSSAGPSS